MATKVEKSVVVDVPVETAYNQWTQFEEFPHFMGGISEVRQIDDTTLHWVAEIAGVRREWKATILEQVPNERVAWAATEGATNAGAVRFAPAGAGQTTVSLELEYEPEGVVETVADKAGLVGRRAEADLEKFKSFIEDEGYASGAWRGTVPGGATTGTPGVEAAEASKGDSGGAGVSAKTVLAGAAGAAALAGGVAAAAKALSGDSEDEGSQERSTAETQVLSSSSSSSVAARPAGSDTPAAAPIETTTTPGVPPTSEEAPLIDQPPPPGPEGPTTLGDVSPDDVDRRA